MIADFIQAELGVDEALAEYLHGMLQEGEFDSFIEYLSEVLEEWGNHSTALEAANKIIEKYKLEMDVFGRGESGSVNGAGGLSGCNEVKIAKVVAVVDSLEDIVAQKGRILSPEEMEQKRRILEQYGKVREASSEDEIEDVDSLPENVNVQRVLEARLLERQNMQSAHKVQQERIRLQQQKEKAARDSAKAKAFKGKSKPTP